MKTKISKLTAVLLVLAMIFAPTSAFSETSEAVPITELTEENVIAEETVIAEENKAAAAEMTAEDTEEAEEIPEEMLLETETVSEEEAGNVTAWSVNTGAVLTESIIDELANFDYIYSCSNIAQVEDNPILTNEAYGDSSLWCVSEVSEAAELVYAVDESVNLSNITVEISRSANIKYPVIMASEDGFSYTDVTARMTDMASDCSGWTQTVSGSRDNLGQSSYEAEASLPGGTKFVKIEIQADSYVRPFYLKKISLTAEPVKEIAENTTDELEDFGYMYSYSNIALTDSENPVGAAMKDTSLMQIENVSKKAELIYKAKEGKSITNIEIGIVRWDAIKFPVIAYSYDGKTYTNLNQPMSAPGYSDTEGYWVHQGNSGYNYYEKYRFSQALPEGVKLVKVLIDSGFIPRNDKFMLRSVSLTVDRAGAIGSSEYQEAFETLDYTSVNEGVDISGTAFLASAGGKLGYKAANGKRMKSYSVSYTGTAGAVTVKAYDLSGNAVTVDEPELTEGGGAVTISGVLPKNAKSIVFENAANISYTAIELVLDTATGYDWLYTESKPTFELSADNILTAKYTALSQAGEGMNVKAVLVIYEGEDIRYIESCDAEANAGEKTEITVSASIAGYTENVKAELTLISDIRNGILIGDTAIYSK